MENITGLGILLSVEDSVILEMVEYGELSTLCYSISLEIEALNNPPKSIGRC